ncbi:MAG: bacillithiol biosynthesis BshC, partial [Bacteroidetes bacterium]|nr:bacillithiol biosynthesis BshC [Bacteroidota bacterium]
MQLNFSDIPGHQNLFLDYLYEFENVNEYYKYNFRDKENYKKIFKSVSESQRAIKSGLGNILKSQYSGLKISKKTKRNLEL